MPEPIATAAEIPLATNLDGSVTVPALEFSPDGSVLYVRQPVSHPSVWEYAAWYGPDVAGALLPIAFISGVVVLRRVLRSARERGRVYCRRCNYALTPPLAERDTSGRVEVPVDARCPECGSTLSRVRPVIGRGIFARLWPVWGVAAPLALACIATLALTLQAWTPGGMTATWPVSGTQTPLARMGLGSWVVQKRFRPRRIGMVNQITRYALPKGERIGDVWTIATRGFNNGQLGAGGGTYLSIVDDPGASGIRLLSIDTATGAHQSVPLAQWTDGADIVGGSADGGSVYVQVVTNGRGPPTSGSPSTSSVSLRAFDSRTLEAREIVSLERPLQARPSGWETAYHTYVINDSASGDLRWALVSCYSDSARAPTHADVVCFDGKDRREFVVPAAGSGWHRPRLLDEGRTLVINHYGRPMPPATRVDLATGAIMSTPGLPVSNFGGSEDGRWRVVAGTKYLEVVDTRSGRVTACLNAPVLGSTSGVVSADGRRVACMMWDSSGVFGPARMVGVWEIPERAASPEDEERRAP